MDVGPRKLCVGSTAKIRPWKSEKGAARAHFALGGPLSCTDRPPFGVANDVDEQDMGDLKLDLFFNFGGHVRKLLRRERGDDFLEARIATERIPKWMKAQIPVS